MFEVVGGGAYCRQDAAKELRRLREEEAKNRLKMQRREEFLQKVGGSGIYF